MGTFKREIYVRHYDFFGISLDSSKFQMNEEEEEQNAKRFVFAENDNLKGEEKEKAFEKSILKLWQI